ncbi:MAG: acyl-CoA dehydrogenase family protein [Candidatus Binataceae bacterium]
MNAQPISPAIAGFVDALLGGRCDWPLIVPFPSQPDDDKVLGDRFLRQFDSDLRRIIKPDADAQDGKIPLASIAELAGKGYLGMRIPREFGGMGLSEHNYFRALSLTGTWCLSTTCTILAHSSIGLTGPLLLFGNEEQKRKYLPRLARGELSGFALTEPLAGNDYSRTTSTLMPSREDYLLSGEKLFITNAPIAHFLCVFARIGDAGDRYALAIVETNQPGFSVVEQCSFLGLPGIHNGMVRFDQMRIPRDAVIGQVGCGFDHLIDAATGGWMTLASVSAGVSRHCLRILRDWANRRVQWGNSIGKHQAIQKILSQAAANAYAIDSVAKFTMTAAGSPSKQFRTLARVAKYFGQEQCWRVVDDALQVCGARGYETFRSARRRAEACAYEERHDEELTAPVDRIFRDFRLFRLAEGSSQTLPLMIALDLFSGCMTQSPRSGDVDREAIRSTLAGLSPENLEHAAFVDRAAALLAHEARESVGTYGVGLEHEQEVLICLGDILTELVAMSASLARANQRDDESTREDRQQLAGHFCRDAQWRIGRNFDQIASHQAGAFAPISERLLSGGLDWMMRDVANP